MLSRKRRPSRDLLEKTMKMGQSYHSPLFTLRLMKVAPESPSVFAFVASSKVEKRAVGRNRLKRRASYALGKVLSSVKSGFVGIFLFKKGASNATFANIESEMKELLKKSGLC